MKRLKIIKNILKQAYLDRILLGYLGFILIAALIILIAEPDITRYGDALWYCYEIISTTGFGEFTSLTFIGRACSVLLTAYSLLIIAVVTGVVTNFYIQLAELRRKGTLAYFIDKLEHLSEMSSDELKDMEESVRQFRRDKNI